MGDVTGSCGHKLGPEDGPYGLGWPAHTKDGDEECFSAVCSECLRKYREWGILIETDSKQLAAEQGVVMCEEKEVKMVEIELDLDDKTVESLIEHAKKNIVNDEKALINWAANDILEKKIKEKENGKSNS